MRTVEASSRMMWPSQKDYQASTKVAVEEAKQIVERVLSHRFANPYVGFWPPFRIREWQGKLSVYPEKVHQDVTSNSMNLQCHHISEELQSSMWDEGFKDVEMIKGKGGHIDNHYYLKFLYNNIEIFIDPTISQYISGHNHVFVGTKDQLRYLALTPSGEGFESIWEKKKPSRWDFDL